MAAPQPAAINQTHVKEVAHEVRCLAKIWFWVKVWTWRSRLVRPVQVLVFVLLIIELLAPFVHFLHFSAPITIGLVVLLLLASAGSVLVHRRLERALHLREGLLRNMQLIFSPGFSQVGSDKLASVKTVLTIFEPIMAHGKGDTIFGAVLCEGNSSFEIFSLNREDEYLRNVRPALDASAAAKCLSENAIIYVPNANFIHGIRIGEKLIANSASDLGNPQRVWTLDIFKNAFHSRNSGRPFESILLAPISVPSSRRRYVLIFASSRRNAFSRFHYDSIDLARRLFEKLLA